MCQKCDRNYVTKKAGTGTEIRICSLKGTADAWDKVIVKKGFQILETEKKSFLYNNTKDCFKKYTHMVYNKLSYDKSEDEESAIDVATTSNTKKSAPMLCRCSVPPGDKLLTKNRQSVNSQKQKWLLCGSDQLWNTSSKKYIYTKYRLYELDPASFFLVATKVFQDEGCSRAAI